MILALLIATISFNSYAQVKTEKDMKQEIKKMEELIQERLGMVKTYPEKPAYYLQVNKTGCRLLVRVNDIPVGYHFVEDNFGIYNRLLLNILYVINQKYGLNL